jgi:hypothetical protein
MFDEPLFPSVPRPVGIDPKRFGYGTVGGALLGLAVTRAMRRDPFIRDYLTTGLAGGIAGGLAAGTKWETPKVP